MLFVDLIRTSSAIKSLIFTKKKRVTGFSRMVMWTEKMKSGLIIAGVQIMRPFIKRETFLEMSIFLIHPV